MPGQRAGVHALDADDAVLDQVLVQGALAAPVAWTAGGVADHVAGGPHAGGFRILGVHAGVADVREGLHDDLVRVGRVSQGFLVAGHAGGEDCFTQGGAHGAIAASAEDAAIFEYQHGW